MSKKLGKKRFIANHPINIPDDIPMNTTDCQWDRQMMTCSAPIGAPADVPDKEEDLIYSDELQEALDLFEKLKTMDKKGFLEYAAKLKGVAPEKLKELAVLKKKTLKRMAPPEPPNQTITYGGSGMIFNTMVNTSSSSIGYSNIFGNYGTYSTGYAVEDDY